MKVVFRRSTTTIALIFVLGAAFPSAGATLPDPQSGDPGGSGQATAAPTSGIPDVREQAVAKRLALSLLRGEISWIETGEDKFLAIYRTATHDPAHGGVIINAPVGATVDSLPLYRILARSAAAAGWSVLSIQQPLPGSRGVDIDNAELTSRAVSRLNAGIAYLVDRRIENIVIVGDAAGAAIAIQYIVAQPSPIISGFVGLRAWNVPLDGMDVPVLGITGTRDLRALSHQAMRMAKLKTRASPVEVLKVDGAGPGFIGYEDFVAKRIRGWLERVTP
ncbi:MAG: DUF3530 family protein, partial [Verrucomicrobia bacterium]|nr:DUF3530 family protein [Verrucomicrobiota bacterium]